MESFQPRGVWRRRWTSQPARRRANVGLGAFPIVAIVFGAVAWALMLRRVIGL